MHWSALSAALRMAYVAVIMIISVFLVPVKEAPPELLIDSALGSEVESSKPHGTYALALAWLVKLRPER